MIIDTNKHMLKDVKGSERKGKRKGGEAKGRSMEEKKNIWRREENIEERRREEKRRVWKIEEHGEEKKGCEDKRRGDTRSGAEGAGRT